ncbi:MAG: hydrogenase maturation nickel metallochaperone HypA [Desulfobulbus oligotrophicus]|jgi:hydrogenase nickel incorporation protein HypA/HybF|nr:hydrogenase maturation nickel metallochaperone HypA [Desulfobulbus oligotrophicus]
MHEMSLAQSLIEHMLTLAREHGASQINRAVVILGPFSGVVRDSFEFGFNILKLEQEPLRETLLVVESPDPEYVCLDCGKQTVFPFTLQEEGMGAAYYNFAAKTCPWCSSKQLSPTGGTELILHQLEME